MRTKIAGHYLSLLALVGFLAGIPSSQGSQEQKPTPLEQYLEIELKRVEETYRLLDRFAREIWPGWDNYHEAGFRIYFPNRVMLLVNPRKAVPAGYELLQGRTVGGKPIYLNRREQLPMEMKLPLTGAGGGGLTVKVRLSQPGTPTSRSTSELGASSDNQILMYVHEIFHGFQEKFGFMPEGDAILNFMSNTGFATYAHIEGLALLQAYRETDQDKALEYLQDYLVAHEHRQEFMTPEMIADEPVILTQEGTATYAEINMAIAIRDKKYTPGIRPQEDPFFFHFQAIDAYIETYTTKSLRKEMADTLDTFGRCYPFGAYQCFLLDRFMPGWKRDFFKSKKTLTELITHLLHLSTEQKQTIAQGLKTRYPYEEIYARHDALIKERDDAVQRVKSRQGTKYILDLVKIREWFQLKARGKEIFLKGIEKIYPHGVETFELGDIRLTTPDTPLRQTWLIRSTLISISGAPSSIEV